jgi:glyoxylase-like metal-dependent hydrolase (beta-lactamase superfamily II)
MKNRFMLKALSQVIAASVFTAGVASAYAAAPLSTVTTPGFSRVMVGDFEVTPLSDGTVDLPMVDLLKNDKSKTKVALEKSHLTTPTTTSVNAYLINTGNKLVLVDAGAGKLFGPSLGKLTESIKASGYKPEQIDDILITHLHPDHVGGLMENGKIAFPNAIVHADKHDSDFWLNEVNIATSPKDFENFFKGAMASLNPYVKAGKFKPFDHNGELMPGISSYASYGHTVGHTTFVVQSKGKKLVILGDLIHAAAVQFDSPDVAIGFDSDTKEAVKARETVFTMASKEGDLVAGAHLQFPGLGYIRANGQAWSWIPANYTVHP